MTSPVLPFPLIEDEHLSGCGDGCDFPLHLTTRAVETLSRNGVCDADIRAILDYELASHTRKLLDPYPNGQAPGWNARIEATLEGLGVDAGVIERAREAVEGRRERSISKSAHAHGDRSDQIKAWKAANKARVAEHSRQYRERRKLRVVK